MSVYLSPHYNTFEVKEVYGVYFVVHTAGNRSVSIASCFNESEAKWLVEIYERWSSMVEKVVQRYEDNLATMPELDAMDDAWLGHGDKPRDEFCG